MDNELGTRIRALRKERGLSQEALAQALEVSRQAVTKWEDSSSLPSTALATDEGFVPEAAGPCVAALLTCIFIAAEAKGVLSR